MLKRKENETNFEYELRLSLMKVRKELDLGWDVVVDLADLDVSPDHQRKVSYGYEKYDDYIKLKSFNADSTDSNMIADLDEKIKEFQKEKIKFQDQRREYNRLLRMDTRWESTEEEIVDAIKLLPKLDIPKTIIHKDGFKAGILTISDPHYGAEFHIKGLYGETLNKYNPEIFEERMWLLLDKAVKKIKNEELTHINLLMLGDAIEGILRMTSLQTLRYGIVDSTMYYAEFMANWLNKLSEYVAIDAYSALGNHSQIRPLGSKNGDFDEENMERIVTWFIKERLKDNKNIVFNDNGNHLILLDIFGMNILASHGEEKDLAKAINDYRNMYNVSIDMFIAGHKHTKETNTVGVGSYGDIETIRVSSIMGCNDYSVKKIRKRSKAGSTMLVFEEGIGKVAEFDFVLN